MPTKDANLLLCCVLLCVVVLFGAWALSVKNQADLMFFSSEGKNESCISTIQFVLLKMSAPVVFINNHMTDGCVAERSVCRRFPAPTADP